MATILQFIDDGLCCYAFQRSVLHLTKLAEGVVNLFSVFSLPVAGLLVMVAPDKDHPILDIIFVKKPTSAFGMSMVIAVILSYCLSFF